MTPRLIASVALVLALVAVLSSCSRREAKKSSDFDDDTATSSLPANAPRPRPVSPVAPAPSSSVDLNDPRENYTPTPEEAAELAKVQQKIASDPRIKSKDVILKIRHSPATPEHVASSVLVIRGSVDTYDEQFAVNADARSVTDMNIAGWNGLPVQGVKHRDPWEVGWGVVPPPPPFVEPEKKTEIPICAGGTIVTAIAGSGGDYESIKTIESVDSEKLVLKYSAETKDGLREVPAPTIKLTRTKRNVLFRDMESSHKYVQVFADDGPLDATGTTSIGVSAAVLRDLKTKGRSDIQLCAEASGHGPIGSDGKPYFVIGLDKKPAFTPAGCTVFYDITLYRVGDTTEPFRVLLDGKPVELQAIHAKATKADHRDEFFFLDDEKNPLTLAFRFGIQSVPALRPSERIECESAKKNIPMDCQRYPSLPKTFCGATFAGFNGEDPPSCDLPDGGDRDALRVVKINTACDVQNKSAASKTGPAGAQTGLEQSLAQGGKVDIYSIFFSFNSDKLREESEPTLNEIADVLKKHSDWKLRIAGHTDGIGGDQSNLDLSRRRAAAVKDALVQRYHVSQSRLTSTGYGKSQPIDTNDTLEGRAHNRRVELSKIN